MKLNNLFLLSVIALLAACQSKQGNEVAEEGRAEEVQFDTATTEDVVIAMINEPFVDESNGVSRPKDDDVVGVQIFNERPDLWGFAIRETYEILNALNDSSKISDDLFRSFLVEYVSTIDKLNDLLFEHEDYEAFNSIIWSDESLHEDKAIEFEKGVAKQGYKIASTEGMIFIERNTDFLNEKLGKHFTSQMTEFYTMYSIENNNPFAEDGGIYLPLDKLVDRAVYWERFKSNYPQFTLSEYVENQNQSYTYYLMMGMDNTPSFGFSPNKELDEVFKNAYDYCIEKYPDTELSKLLREYLVLLTDSDFKETPAITDFTKKYNPY